MKNLDTSHIGSGVRLGLDKPVLDFIASKNDELINQIIYKILNDPDPSFVYDSTKMYVLYGCNIYPSGGNFGVTAGLIFYNGELYVVDAVSPIPDVTDVVIITSYDVSDPQTYTDSSTYNTLQTNKISFNDGATGTVIGLTADLFYMPSVFQQIGNYLNQVNKNINHNTTWGSPETVSLGTDNYNTYTGTHVGLNTLAFNVSGSRIGRKVNLTALFSAGASLAFTTPASWTIRTWVDPAVNLGSLATAYLLIEVEVFDTLLMNIKVYQLA